MLDLPNYCLPPIPYPTPTAADFKKSKEYLVSTTINSNNLNNMKRILLCIVDKPMVFIRHTIKSESIYQIFKVMVLKELFQPTLQEE